MITKFQIIKLFLGRILNYIFSVIRNGLYLPYVTSLFLYLLFISVIIFFSFFYEIIQADLIIISLFIFLLGFLYFSVLSISCAFNFIWLSLISLPRSSIGYD
jgi:hypothetical protein